MTLTAWPSGLSNRATTPTQPPTRRPPNHPALRTACDPRPPTQQFLDRVDQKERGRPGRHVVPLMSRPAADQPQRLPGSHPQRRRPVVEPVLDLALQHEPVVTVEAPIVARGA